MKWLDRLEELIIMLLMAAATLITFAAVVHRYSSGFQTPLQDWLIGLNFSWAQEATIYLFVWMAKFGAAYGVRTGIHVGIDVLINKLQPKNYARMVLFGLCAGALFTGVITVMGWGFVWHNGMEYALFHAVGMDVSHLVQGPTTPDLEWPTWAIYLAIPLGTMLMCFRFLQVAVSFSRTGELPKHDHSHVDGMDEEIAALNSPNSKEARA